MRRERRILAAVASVGVAAPLLLGMGAASSAVTTATARFDVAADTFVSEAAPGANFGSRGTLRSSASKRSYLKFNVGTLSGPVRKATLKLYATASNSDGFKVAGTGSGWSEKDLTWNNAPAPGTVVDRSGAATSGSWVTVDVTSLVTGPGLVGFAVLPVNGGSGEYQAREGGRRDPRLVVETEVTTSTTAAPTTTTTAGSGTTTTTTAPTGGGGGGMVFKLPQGCGTVPQTARQAAYNVLGYAWADGHDRPGGGANFRSRGACSINRIKADLKMADIPYTTRSEGNLIYFHVADVFPFNETLAKGTPKSLNDATPEEIAYFLAGTIEAEGSGNGKVLDDFEWTRAYGVVDVYKRVGPVVVPDHKIPTCGCSSDPSYWNVYVDPDAAKSVYNGYIETIRSFPFAEMGRVPQYR